MVSFRTLGSLDLRSADDIELRSVLAQPKRVALLAYLAIATPRGFHRRDKLLVLFWPDSDESHARNALRQALHFLRRSLGPQVLCGRGDEELRVDDSRLWCDAVAFEMALDQGRPEEALELYAGPFLGGFHIEGTRDFDEWVETERARLAGRALDAAAGLAAADEAAGNTRSAVRWARLAATFAPENEEVLRRLVDLLDRTGDKAGALRAFKRFERRLDEDYQIAPGPEARALVERVRSRRLAGVREGSDPGPASVSAEGATHSPLRASLPPTGHVPSPGEESLQRPAPSAASRRRGTAPERRTTVVGGVAICAATLLLVAIGLLRSVDVEPPSVPRTVVLGDIRSGDPSLALAIQEALRVELEALPSTQVVGEAATAGSLVLMRLPPDTPLDVPTALALAQRRGVPLVVAGSVTPLGTGMQLVVRLLDSRTGATLATFSERPRREQDVIPAVTSLVAALREHVAGVSVPGTTPLPAVSTVSLPALRSYALARQALAALDRRAAVRLGEAALVHDSMFALAHYLVGDQLWYLDQQRHSDEHMQRAFELAASLPPRERLIVRARYEQLVHDRPDSALAYWQLLAESYPDEPLAYEGMRWVHRAMGRIPEMADASALAYALDSTWLRPYVADRLQALSLDSDTTATRAFARSFVDRVPEAERWAEYLLASSREDWSAAMEHSGGSKYLRHFLLLAAGEVEQAALELPAIRGMDLQYYPRALLLQARAGIARDGGSERERALVREALEWTATADLSPPAYARLAERIADAAARAGDPETVAAARTLILARDRGRQLRSYVSALAAIDAADAFAAGEYERAAASAAEAAASMFYGRSVATVLLLEADARAALGQRQQADSIYDYILRPRAFVDGDPETLALLRRTVREELQNE